MRFQVDDGDLGGAPKTHVEPVTSIVKAAGVRENAQVIQFAVDSFACQRDCLKSGSRRRQRDIDDLFLPQVDFGSALAIQICHTEPSD